MLVEAQRERLTSEQINSREIRDRLGSAPCAVEEKFWIDSFDNDSRFRMTSRERKSKAQIIYDHLAFAFFGQRSQPNNLCKKPARVSFFARLRNRCIRSLNSWLRSFNWAGIDVTSQSELGASKHWVHAGSGGQRLINRSSSFELVQNFPKKSGDYAINVFASQTRERGLYIGHSKSFEIRGTQTEVGDGLNDRTWAIGGDARGFPLLVCAFVVFRRLFAHFENFLCLFAHSQVFTASEG